MAMQFYTERYAANAEITADDAVDGENAVLTIGKPTNPTAADPDEKTQGTIRNEPYRNISYMDLTMDFISANNGSNPVNTNYYGDHIAVGETDIRKLQGFYLNRLPNRDELSYNSLSSSNDRDKMATMYVQFYDDVDTNGNLRSDLTLHVPYDKADPNADRYAKNGYRKVYPASSSLVAADGAVKTNEDWYYWDEADRHFKPVDPRKIVRLRIEYMSLNAKDTVTGGYLVLPEIRLYGINVWQDIYPKRVQKAYSYNYGVDITQEWYRDASENDNSSNIAPDAPLDPSKTGAELEKEYMEKNGISPDSAAKATASDADSVSTEIENDTYRWGIGRRIRAQVIRRMPQVAMKAETFETEEKAKADNAEPMTGYRPNQPLWNKVTIKNGNKTQKVATNSRNSGNLALNYTADSTKNDTGDNTYTWSNTTVNPEDDKVWGKDEVLGTGQIYKPTIIDKVPVDYVDLDPNMFPSDDIAADPSALGETPVPIDTARWKQAVTIRWYDANGNLKSEDEYNNTTLTVYKMQAKDIGGMQAFDRDTMDDVKGEIAPNSNDTSKTAASKKEYYVYTYTFDCKYYNAALLRGERIEIIYKTTAKKKGLPVSTYMGKGVDENNNGKMMYLPKFGQYSFHNAYTMGAGAGYDNAVAPTIADTATRLMDMSNLLHDAGFTGKRSGQRRVYVPVPDPDDPNKMLPVLNDENRQKTYLDDTKQPRYEFMDRSSVKIPGSADDQPNAGDYNYGWTNNGYNDRFFDQDSDSSQKQTVIVNAIVSDVGNDGDKVTELQYTNDHYNSATASDPYTKYIRSWYKLLMRDRTYLLTEANGKDGQYIDKGVKTEETEENGRKENILWAEDSLHLQTAWLAGFSNILTDRYYAGDIEGNYDQYVDDKKNYQYGVDSLRIYTPALQYGNEFSAKLTAINYGDWALDGVTFTYVYPLGTMPKLEESQNDEFTSLPEKPKAYYGGALGDQGKTSVIPEKFISAKIIQRPGKPADTGVYLAPKTAMDPVLADDYSNGTYEMYPEAADEIPWVVQFTVKSPLTQWWGREKAEAIKASAANGAKGYQITLNAPAVVYRQPDNEKYYDMVYTSPYDDGRDGNQTGVTDATYNGMEADAAYCQIYDESYRSGDVTTAERKYSNLKDDVTNWTENNNYHEIYGMDQLYRLNKQVPVGNSGEYSSECVYIYSSNPRVYTPFTPFYIGRNWFSSTYERAIDADGNIAGVPKTKDSRFAGVSDYSNGREHYAVSGSQARLLKPVIRHWSEAADPDKTTKIQDQKKFDQFYQELETPFTISMFAENQSVMKNIQKGAIYSRDNKGGLTKLDDKDHLIHYQNPERKEEQLNYKEPFENYLHKEMYYSNGGYHDTYEDYDTRHTAPGFNQLSGGYIKGKTAAGKADDRIITIPYAKENAVSEGADYPLPVLSSLLPEGIVPVDKNGKPWPKDPTGTNWVNADLDFDITVRQASTLQDGNANKVVTTADQPENLPTKANYREEITYIQSAGRYMVRLVPVDGYVESAERMNDPLTNPLTADEMQSVLKAPKLKWNQSVQMDIRVMAVEMPQSDVTANGRSQSDSYTDKDEPETNILLRRWQQNRSFASSWVDGFKFLTDDRSLDGSNKVEALKGNPFEVGQEYSGYYMADSNCGWKFPYEEGHYLTDNSRVKNYVHIFDDTRLDTTGPDGRIKDRTLIGDMIRGWENADKTIDIEDYSKANITQQTDLKKLGTPDGNAYKQGLRVPNLVSYAELDVNGNGRSGRQENNDASLTEDVFVTNTMKLYVKNPNIMLDKKISSYMDEKGLGDNDGYPDYRGRSLPEADPDDTGTLEHSVNRDKVYDDYAENKDLLFTPDNGNDPNGNGVDYNGLGYGSRLWYSVTVMNKPVDSPMHTGSDYSGPVKDALGDTYVLPRQDADNEYLTKEDGTFNALSNGWGATESSTDSKYSGLKLKVPGTDKQDTYEEQLAIRRRKLSESGCVAHGAFVFSDYLPWILDYDSNDSLDGIGIEIEDAKTGKVTFLKASDAIKAGWIIKDDTPAADPAVNNGARQFVSITVVPPATKDMVIGSEEAAYKLFETKDRPAGYLANGDKFTLKIRTKVCDIPDVKAEKGNYDENGYSKEIFYNRAFVNLDNLDGNYGKLKGTEENTWYGDQKKDSISYYSGTESRNSDKKTTVRDNKDLPADKFLKQKNVDADKTNNLLIQNASNENYNQKDSTDDRYAFDTAAGFKVVSPRGFARVTTSRPVENRNGKYQDPAYKSTENVQMYLGETSLLRGSVGSIYTISNLPLYGVNTDSYNPDLTAENYKNYAGYKVGTTVQSIKPGIWSAPNFSLYGNTQADRDAYQKQLEENLQLTIYVSLRSESGDMRQVIKDGFDINAHYDGDPSKPVIWHPVMEPVTLAALKAGNIQETGFTVPSQYRNDINQVMWEIKSTKDNNVLGKYPIPAGFRLDVDVDYTKTGSQDAHTLENKGITTMTGHYPLHQIPFTASSSNAVRCDDVKRSGGQINMNVNALSSGDSTLNTDTFMANYTDIYVKYGEDRYCRLSTGDTRYDTSSLKTYEETYRRSGLILVLYSPIGELKLEGRYLKQITSENGEMLDSSQFYYNWQNDMSLTGSSRLLAYTVTLDNINDERLKAYGNPDSEQKEDSWMKPTVVVKIPSLMEIDSTNLQYKDYYKDVEGNTDNPLNPDYKIRTSYPNAAPLYWTYRVVHRDYDGGNGAGYHNESTTTLDKDTTADLISAATYKPYKSVNGENFLKFFFDGSLKPGDSIVIDFMVRVRTTDPSSPLAQGNNKVINAYATDNVGNPKWVDWKRSDDDAADAGTHQIRDDYDYDEDKQSTETLLTVKNDTITFAAMDAFSIPKMVTSILTPDEGPSYNKSPVPVLEGETYTYKLQMSNLATYSPDNPNSNMHRSPVLYDIWPFAGDKQILKNTDGSIGNRESRWNAWMLPEKEQFTLTASSGASLQRYDNAAMPLDPQTNTFVIPQKDYKIWVGPLDVTRNSDGTVDTITPPGTDILNDDQFIADRSMVKDSADNFYQQLAVSAFGGAANAPDGYTSQTSTYDIRTNHVTLDELSEYRTRTTTTAAQYDKIRKALRDMAVTFNEWPGASVNGGASGSSDPVKQAYKMYASTTFTLTYKAETPLNLPVYVADRDSVDASILKKMIKPYVAGNSFVASTEVQKPAESWTAQVYVHNPEDRGEIGDYIWLDDNTNGLEDEIEYAIPDTGDAKFTRSLPKRDRNGKPDWGKEANGDDKPDPGINGVLVELLNENGQPCNFDGQAVDENQKTIDGYYIILDENGNPKMDAGGNAETTKYGPWTCISRSDYYGNQGYYILPNLKAADENGEPLKYKLRFVLPESYNDYGLTTWEIGKGSQPDDTVKMDTIVPDETKYGYTAKTLTFITKDAISVRAAKDKTDDENVSYDVGIGLPVAYGGATWLDISTDPVHSYDGYYDNEEYQEDPTDVNDDHAHAADQEKGFVYKEKGSGKEKGAIITAVVAGQETEADGITIKPALDMRGNPMVTETYTMASLKAAYYDLKAKDVASRKTDTDFTRGKAAYKELSDKYPAKYPAPPADGSDPTDADLEKMLEPFVGTYAFKYMIPDVEYKFFISLPKEEGSGKELYQLTGLIDDEPLKRRFESDAKADGWTHSFKAVRPALLARWCKRCGEG